MSKKGRILRITFLAAAFAVVIGFAVQGNARARHYQRLLESTYAHAFTELTTAAGELDSALQKAAYTVEGSLRQRLYQEMYAKALEAQYALGELPFQPQELEHTAAFFAKTGDYAAALCRGDCDNYAENLSDLASISKALNQSLSQLQSDLEAGALHLEQVEQAVQALSRQAEGGGQETGGSVFQDVESEFPEMPSLIYDGPFSEHLSHETPLALEGMADVDQEAARRAAADFLQRDAGAFTLVSAGSGAMPTYAFTLPEDGGAGYIEVTRQGGQVIAYFQDRVPKECSFTARQGVELARDYLLEWGFGDMQPSYHIQREGSLTVHFAPVADGVYCYPDLVKVTVALDNGKLLGYEGHGYLYRHRVRAFEAPAVSREDALRAVPEGLSVLASQLALIPTAGGTEEVLTYEFKCEAPDGSHVLIYANAATGEQENILLLLEDETGTLTL